MVFIGKIKKIHGLKGELFFELMDEYELDTENIKFLLLAEKNSAPVPFFLSQLLPCPGGYFVKFENSKTPADAKQFLNRDVFVDEQFIFETEESNELFLLRGFLLKDKNHGELGKIDAVMEIPGQILFTVIHSTGKEILLPANDTFILKIDTENKVVEYEAPEGLVEVYL